MNIEYQKDDARRRVTIIVSGPFDLSGWHEGSAQRHHREQAWSYAMLYDLRAMTGVVSIDDLKSIFAASIGIPLTTVRGPVAIVAADQRLYMSACTFAALGRNALTVEVFRDLIEAETWLVTKTVG